MFFSWKEKTSNHRHVLLHLSCLTVRTRLQTPCTTRLIYFHHCDVTHSSCVTPNNRFLTDTCTDIHEKKGADWLKKKTWLRGQCSHDCHLESWTGYIVLWSPECSKEIPRDFQRCLQQVPLVWILKYSITSMGSWRCLHCCSPGILVYQGPLETEVKGRPLRSISGYLAVSQGPRVAEKFLMRLRM